MLVQTMERRWSPVPSPVWLVSRVFSSEFHSRFTKCSHPHGEWYQMSNYKSPSSPLTSTMVSPLHGMIFLQNKYLTSSDPHPDAIFWHSFWYIIWKYIYIYIYSDILSDILSGIYSGILSGLLTPPDSYLLLLTPAHSYSLLLTPTHSYSLLLTPAHSYSLPHSYSLLLTPAYSCSLLVTPTHSYF
jgi:hypothetical protein